MLHSGGIRAGHFFIIHVGTGSIVHDLLAELAISFVISFSVVEVKVASVIKLSL